MPRKLSAETPATHVDLADFLDGTVDPAGTPASRAVPVSVVGQRIGPSNMWLPIEAASLGAHVLTNGGSVTSATATAVAGNTIGMVDNYIQFDIVDPTPALGPCIVVFPITLPAGVPSQGRIQWNTFPATPLTNYGVGLQFDTAATALAVYNNRAAAPGPTRNLTIAEFSALSGTPASWSYSRAYANQEQMTLNYRAVLPFATSPQLAAFDIQARTNEAAVNTEVFASSAFPTSGSFNAANDWDGEVFTALNVMFLFGSAYVGTVTERVALRLDF